MKESLKMAREKGKVKIKEKRLKGNFDNIIL